MIRGVSLDDFVSGIAAGFVSQGLQQVQIKDVDAGFLGAFWFLKSLEKSRFEVRFHVALNARTSRCETARMGLLRAYSNDLLSWSGDEYKICMTQQQSEAFFVSSPVSQAEWELISNQVLIPESQTV